MIDFSSSVSPLGISIFLITLDLLAELLGFRVDADVREQLCTEVPTKRQDTPEEYGIILELCFL